MAFKKIVVKELNCPRCNAWAQLRVEEERGTICVLYIVCSKCKLQKYNSLITRRSITLISKREKLTERLNSPIISEEIKSRLRKMIHTLDIQIKIENLKLGG